MREAVAFLSAYLNGLGTQAQKGVPSRAVGLFRLGEALAHVGRCPEARAHVDSAAALEPRADGLATARREVEGRCR